MLSSLCGVIGIFLAMTVIRGNFKLWQSKHWLPKGFTGVSLSNPYRTLLPYVWILIGFCNFFSQLVSSSALLVFAYPSEVPATGSCKRLKGAIICVFICFAIMLCTGCLTAVVEFRCVLNTSFLNHGPWPFILNNISNFIPYIVPQTNL